ncbi:uncharacterized protein PSFLO_03018 [Pseudozyma flocculosa]|uniref:Secreted protein n=1 Tax=Pseudozyma flocculosa TaxID=84751 RepID=A0A5C3EZ41_9BASI|nr:uncharacterized protein PSFLO_03018 [Pseudozyma flocculosa]
MTKGVRSPCLLAFLAWPTKTLSEANVRPPSAGRVVDMYGRRCSVREGATTVSSQTINQTLLSFLACSFVSKRRQRACSLTAPPAAVASVGANRRRRSSYCIWSKGIWRWSCGGSSQALLFDLSRHTYYTWILSAALLRSSAWAPCAPPLIPLYVQIPDGQSSSQTSPVVVPQLEPHTDISRDPLVEGQGPARPPSRLHLVGLAPREPPQSRHIDGKVEAATLRLLHASCPLLRSSPPLAAGDPKQDNASAQSPA